MKRKNNLREKGLDTQDLQRSLILKHLPREYAAEVRCHFEPMVAPRGTVLCEQGCYGKNMYLLALGAAVVTVKGDVGDVVVGKLKSGDFFGELSVWYRQPMTATVRSTTVCELWCLSKTALPSIQALLEKSGHSGEIDRQTKARRLSNMLILADSVQDQLAGHAKRIPILSSILTHAEISQLCALLTPEMYIAGDVVFSKAHLCDRLLLVFSEGCVASFSAGGTNVLPLGSFCGYLCLLQHKWPFTALARGNVDAWSIKQSSLHAFLKKISKIDVAVRLMRLHAQPLLEERWLACLPRMSQDLTMRAAVAEQHIKSFAAYDDVITPLSVLREPAFSVYDPTPLPKAPQLSALQACSKGMRSIILTNDVPPPDTSAASYSPPVKELGLANDRGTVREGGHTGGAEKLASAVKKVILIKKLFSSEKPTFFGTHVIQKQLREAAAAERRKMTYGLQPRASPPVKVKITKNPFVVQLSTAQNNQRDWLAWRERTLLQKRYEEVYDVERTKAMYALEEDAPKEVPTVSITKAENASTVNTSTTLGTATTSSTDCAPSSADLPSVTITAGSPTTFTPGLRASGVHFAERTTTLTFTPEKQMGLLSGCTDHRQSWSQVGDVNAIADAGQLHLSSFLQASVRPEVSSGTGFKSPPPPPPFAELAVDSTMSLDCRSNVVIGARPLHEHAWERLVRKHIRCSSATPGATRAAPQEVFVSPPRAETPGEMRTKQRADGRRLAGQTASQTSLLRRYCTVRVDGCGGGVRRCSPAPPTAPPSVQESARQKLRKKHAAQGSRRGVFADKVAKLCVPEEVQRGGDVDPPAGGAHFVL